MASAIHFKMKSEKDFSTLSFDGDFLKVSDLKLLVVEKRKLNYGDGFDLVITDAQTNEGMLWFVYLCLQFANEECLEYADESTLIPKNTSVVIKRVPGQKPGGILSQQTLARRNERYAEKDLAKNNNNNNKNSTSVESSSGDKTKHGGNNISSSGGDQPRQVAGEGEDERIHSVVDSSTITYSQRPRFTQHNPVFDRPPPPNYRCHRCGKPGHWIHHCPTNGDPNFDIVRVSYLRLAIRQYSPTSHI
jgi:E3 ubiquitin-protein ligase RBBP6